MRTSKQVIVMRKDLNMRKGKMVAQGAHASLKALLDLSKHNKSSDFVVIPLTKNTLPSGFVNEPTAVHDWITGIFTKVCVSVNSENELLEIYNKAKDAGLICSIIKDAGLTEFNGNPTLTCCAIGPAWSDEIDEITGKLPLL